ncbi:MAG: type II toxin-antitoxin system prevent-host-death family antitoxin [Bacteroidetes bacterium]|nr:type II toxin-antitoxin system prevent-host-death family antitoxin [Bacteroidota bacterium]
MKSITYSHARQNLARVMEGTCRDREPVIVTRARNESVVILSLEEFEALEETAHLLRSPTNARRLLESMLQLEEGKGSERELED